MVNLTKLYCFAKHRTKFDGNNETNKWPINSNWWRNVALYLSTRKKTKESYYRHFDMEYEIIINFGVSSESENSWLDSSSSDTDW